MIKRKKKKHVNHLINDKKDFKKKKVKRKWWKKLLSFLIVCCALGVFAVFGFLVYIVSTSGEFDPNKLANQDQTIIYDSESHIIAKLGIEKRESVKYNKLPQVLNKRKRNELVPLSDDENDRNNSMDNPNSPKILKITKKNMNKDLYLSNTMQKSMQMEITNYHDSSTKNKLDRTQSMPVIEKL